MIDADCETTGLQPWSGKHHAFMWTFFDGELKEALYPGQDDARIQWWFDRGATEGIRAWNTKFDKSFADIQGWKLPGNGCWHDGMLEAQAIDERRSVALKAVSDGLWPGSDELQKKVHKWLTEERKRRKKAAREAGEEMVYPDFSDVPREIMEPYGLEDVVLTRKVCDHYAPLLEQSPQLRRTIEFERGAMDALYAVEKRGLPAEIDSYRSLEVEVLANLETYEERCLALAAEGDKKIYNAALGRSIEDCEEDAEGDFNPKSTPQVIAALEARGADLSFMERKGGKIVSADADQLRAVDDELAVALLEFRSEYKVLSTYIRPMVRRTFSSRLNSYKEPYVAEDGYIHTTYRQVGARTGRMSSADPNVQNQPRDDLRLRYNIAAKEGHKLVVCDLSNIEMVLFAMYCGEGRLLDAVKNGEDLHTLTAKMLGFRDRARAGGVFETARQQGKTYNFSRVYGGGLPTIMKQRRCSKDDARKLRARFDTAYPEVRRLQNRIEFKLSDQGYISDSMISGRRFRAPEYEAYKLTNYLVQGTAAALFKEACVKLEKDGIPIVGLVHDEILAHVPTADAKEAERQIIQRLTENEAIREFVPLNAEGDIVDRWSQAKNPDFVPQWKAA